MKKLLFAGLLGLATLLASAGLLQAAESEKLSDALTALHRHVDGTAPLETVQVETQSEIIRKNIAQIGSPAVIREALAFSDAYEERVGPLFMNKATRNGFPRTPKGGLELERAVFAVQQGLVDYAYSPERLRQNLEILDGAAFRTSAYFPGAVDAPKDPEAAHVAKINASQPACWGIPVMDAEKPARRPTGCYLAPGSIAKVRVPRSMVGKRFAVRVGAHSWDLKKKPKIKRLDRVSIVYPIEAEETLVANPLGGGIYIEVPYEADAGWVDVRILNAVQSPFFSARSVDRTTPAQWKMERAQPGPWADFESDRFMMQVPTDWIYRFDDPERLMKDWDTALDMVSRLFGYPSVRNKTVLYLQVDVIMRGNANFPGYPQSNTPYNPRKKENGKSRHWLLKGPQSEAGAITCHELGHAQLFTKFKGEVEAVVNLPYVSVLNRGFGVDLDTAFGRSFRRETISLDQAAIMWMVTENFRAGKPMDISNSSKNEVRYQHRGYGKYVEIAHLFGWPALDAFWRSVQNDYLEGIEYPRNSDPTDSRILRMSKAAGADLTPLIHFWGVQPENTENLRAEMRKNGLKPSAKIYDRLLHYGKLIPINNADFAAHAKVVYPKGIESGKGTDYGEGWYYATLSSYNELHGKAAREALCAIIKTYFPACRPTE